MAAKKSTAASGNTADRSDKATNNVNSNAIKDPETWTTGSEPMTGAQKSYLGTLSDEAHVERDDSLSKAEASERIEALRGQHVVQHRADNSADASNTVKDPSHWATGGEPMTGAQKSYLKTLSDEAGQPMDDSLSKGEASQRIDELRQSNPRTN